MLRDEKLDRILASISKIEVYMATSNIHIDNHAKDIGDLKAANVKHEADRNRAYGFLTLIGLAGTAFFSWLFKSPAVH